MKQDSATLSVGKAARQLGVAPVTVQRWVDSAVLAAERTVGGHRRIPVTEVRRLLASLRPNAVQPQIGRWLDVLVAGGSTEVRAALLAARERHSGWAAVAEEVAAVIAEIGRQWEVGQWAVYEEHVASEALHRAAAACAEAIARVRDAPHAVLLSVAGERHTLGLSLAELVLADVGWAVLWVGEGPPADELEDLLARRRPDLLVVAASAASRSAHVASYQKALIASARKSSAKLVLGGSGPWEPSRYATRAVAFADLDRIARRLLSAQARSRGQGA